MNELLRGSGWFLFCAAGGLVGQAAPAPAPATAAQPAPAVVGAPSEAHVRDLVEWLASDERLGRDSPSPGLTEAAGWLARHFEAAGLEPGVHGAWLHEYSLPGQRLDSRSLEVQLQLGGDGEPQRIQLKGDADVRLLTAPATAEGRDERALVVRIGDPRADRLSGVGGSRRATLLEVDESAPLWRATAAVREVVTRRLRGSAPVFLVRRGLLPDTGPPPVGREPDLQWTASWKGAIAEDLQTSLANVVGVLRGAALPDEYVVVSAHYDHIGIGPPVDGDAIRNGADDDATGTTAVVTIAEALAHGPRPRRSVAFVCFSAEEKGLRGSQAFADAPPFPLESIAADVNIEMIGRPEAGHERAAWITGRDYSDFAAIAAPALRRGGIELIDFGMAKTLFAQSDNLSLARHGVVAHSISAGSLHADYHRPSDEVAKLDLAHMTAVIGGLIELVREFADRDGRPQYNDDGRAFLQNLRPR